MTVYGRELIYFQCENSYSNTPACFRSKGTFSKKHFSKQKIRAFFKELRSVFATRSPCVFRSLRFPFLTFSFLAFSVPYVFIPCVFIPCIFRSLRFHSLRFPFLAFSVPCVFRSLRFPFLAFSFLAFSGAPVGHHV